MIKLTTTEAILLADILDGKRYTANSALFYAGLISGLRNAVERAAITTTGEARVTIAVYS